MVATILLWSLTDGILSGQGWTTVATTGVCLVLLIAQFPPDIVTLTGTLFLNMTQIISTVLSYILFFSFYNNFFP